MANDGKIYITISDKRTGTGPDVIPGVPAPTTGGDSNDDSFSLKTYAGVQLSSLIKREAKTLVSYSIGNIGNFTGNYLAQKDIQNAMSIFNSAKSIATAVGSGLILSGGNPIVGAIAGMVAVTSEATNQILNMYSQEIENRKINKEISLLRQRSGLDSLTNNGRTGE